MTLTCPDCGAVYAADRTCQTVFDEFLALEFTDPGYGEVHFLTVACFMVQHGRYSTTGLVWIEQRLRDVIERGVPVAVVRQQAARETGSDRRTWRVTRRPGDPPQASVEWSMTIHSVAAQYQDAASYCELVRKWARATLAEMQPLVHADRQ